MKKNGFLEKVKKVIGKIILASYVFKILFAAIDTPFAYLGVLLLRRYLAKSPS